MFQKKIFNISSFNDFNKTAIEIFNYQYKYNNFYQKYVNYLSIDFKKVKYFEQIPFLPIGFFKTHKIITGRQKNIDAVFISSGTTSFNKSKHYISDISIYEKSFKKGFEYFYGNINDYCIIALLPSYLEKKGSSLIYMVKSLIKQSNNRESKFYSDNYKDLICDLKKICCLGKQKILLIGTSFALLDIAEQYSNISVPNMIVMETGGMKGKRKELTRQELHYLLSKNFGAQYIHSEYGMTELLSQAYSVKNGIFKCPPWMKILIRDINDPFTIIDKGKTGGINIIDLANFNSCSFIATQDLGKLYKDESFEVLGRFDYSDIRGCNLMMG
jgi:phenylacetate-coenzyme A ligase PaaK-like adenylate-forming protein